MKSKLFALIIFIVSVPLICKAPPAGTGGSPVCWPPPCIPIDGGISLLVAAGAIYGGKKLYFKRKEKKAL
ncbi:MAG: hypothetical protein K9H41_00350 [Bacteroidia bacterium]|nr:hypothetical protein [Bacteroidia bacterium]